MDQKNSERLLPGAALTESEEEMGLNVGGGGGGVEAAAAEDMHIRGVETIEEFFRPEFA